ncbi:MAG TPA: 2-C-methyl-D-erythritol 2,4-cyclodiphosphate synthase [Synergistales bacterium]|nr:2-C-methyl-D-erythritol 2,4-cyclodiphosphate synthase [Synergistales bacterium]
MRDVSFLIVAAGKGKRLGGTLKQFRMLGGVPLWFWSFSFANEMFSQQIIKECIICVPEENLEDISHKAGLYQIPSRVIVGGSSRTDTVLKGLAECRGDKVLIHDAARPFLNLEVCLDLISCSDRDTGSIPCIPISDALKELRDETLSPVGREKLYITQTPQCFNRAELIRILESHQKDFRDEAEAWLISGRNLKMVEGDPLTFKITYESDWKHAEMVARGKREHTHGIGYDIHQLVPGRVLILGGIIIEDFPLGLKGHSDGDVVIHAIADSLLGATGNPDIGTLFPSSDPSYRNMDSRIILDRVMEMAHLKGWQIDHVDIVINAQKPILKDHVEPMRNCLSRILFPSEDKTMCPNITVKIKSGEGTGPVGNCECITCTVLSSLSRIRFWGDEIRDI